ncbi:hypothetical protein BDV19DRAFT_384120 [Aspergillus venezuelensis]
MPNINTLTPELIDLIITHLHDLKLLNPAVPLTPNTTGSFLPKNEKLSRYCTILRTWQFAVERYTFADIMTSSDELPRLKSLVGACPHRIQLLKVLAYYVDLPGYSERRKYQVETDSENEANLEHLRQGVVDLWNLLKSWESYISPSGLRLVLSAVARGETKNTFADNMKRIEEEDERNSAYTAPYEDEDEIKAAQDREALRNGTFPYRSYRRTPDPPLFNPLVHSLVRATQRMPNLQEAIVSTNNGGDDDYGVQFHFFAPGQLVESLVELGVTVRSTSRTWRVLPEEEMNWEVPGEIRGMMEEHVGVGGEVVVGWGDVDRVND